MARTASRCHPFGAPQIALIAFSIATSRAFVLPSALSKLLRIDQPVLECFKKMIHEPYLCTSLRQKYFLFLRKITNRDQIQRFVCQLENSESRSLHAPSSQKLDSTLSRRGYITAFLSALAMLGSAHPANADKYYTSLQVSLCLETMLLRICALIGFIFRPLIEAMHHE